jgi:hypothetical protein
MQRVAEPFARDPGVSACTFGLGAEAAILGAEVFDLSAHALEPRAGVRSER